MIIQEKKTKGSFFTSSNRMEKIKKNFFFYILCSCVLSFSDFIHFNLSSQCQMIISWLVIQYITFLFRYFFLYLQWRFWMITKIRIHPHTYTCTCPRSNNDYVWFEKSNIVYSVLSFNRTYMNIISNSISPYVMDSCFFFAQQQTSY